MPEMPNVIASESIEAEWGNAIRDRTVQRYDDVTTRTSENPTPDAGELAYMEDTGDLAVYHSGSWRKFVPAGVVLPYAGSAVPTGYLLCNGAAVSRTTYAALFTAIGTTFGAGDGSTTFNLPDVRGRFILGVAASGTGSSLGAVGGSIDHTHSNPSTASGGSHTHDQGSSATDGGLLETGANDVSLAHEHDVTINSAGSHTHSFSDTTSSGSSSWNVPITGGTAVSADGHTHTVSGTTGSGGTHSHTGSTSSELGIHRHDTPNHSHDLGTSGSGGSHTHTQGDTGAENPPFLALHLIIKS
jgi:microcystin-dependent protein